MISRPLSMFFRIVAVFFLMVAVNCAMASTVTVNDSADIDYSSIEDEDNVSTLQRNISILSDAYNENTHTSEVPNKAGTLAPLNPDFIKYQTKMSMQIKSQEAQEYGYLPSPVNLSHLEENKITGNSTKEHTIYETSVGTYPSAYDLRKLGKVTPVRNQGSAGSCWAFATYASLESCLLLNGTYDFSENNMKNLLNNWQGSPYQDRFDAWEGGDAWMSAAYLARWSGPINESDDPYNTTYGISPAGLSEQKHIQEVLRLTNVDAIKNAIMNHGAVQTSFYWNSLYYNVTDHSYYCPRPGSNHAVAIVGWDDNFTSPEFPEKGAYIIKNSWGDGWGEEGYFYLSYYDANAGDEATIFIAEKTDNYDNLYQYDPLGWTSSFGYGTTTWGANVFTAEADEALKAVSFYTTSNDIQYIVYIYLNPVHGSPINSSGPVAVKSGKFPEAGYHTVPLDAGVLLVPNKDFSVVVKFTTPGYTNPLAIETPIYLYSTKATADSGQSYVSKDGTEWSDLKSLYDNTNACIKAFTSASISTVDASEEADYISIQAAINNSSEGSTIFVYPGTYYENVDVDRQLDIISIGGGAVTDVIAASSNDHVFEIKADGVTISGFNISGASTSSSAGICLHGSGKTLLSNNIVSDNSCGIYLQSSDNNVIYNNHFNNLVNVYSSGTSTGSVWNITKTAGRNIAGGPYLGGNFWHRPDGTGFSQVAEDADGDGICDSAYALLPDNIDTLPLATPDQKYPVINSITLNNSTPCRGDLIFVTVNATDNRGVQSVNANDISLEFQGDNIWIGTITALKGKHSVNVAVMDATTNVAWDNTTTYTATTIPIIVDASGGADYTTIQNAVNASVAEDLIIVYPGIYSENVVIDRQLDIISTGGAALTSVTAASATKHVFEITADRVTIDGFSVSGATGSLRAGIYLSSSYDSMLINNIVSGNSYGIYLSSSGNGTLVNNTVSCNGLNGIYLVSSHNNTLADNAVSDNEWNGLFLISSSNITLVNNAVSNNAWDGIYMVSLINSTLKNNTISNNNGNGISLSFSSNNNSMTNNSVSKNAAHGIRLFSSSDNLIYNNLFNNSVNTHVDVECNDNVWNITKIAGINIAGGPYLGGNCWTKPEGSGFSQTHFDNDKDGICESVHALNDNNIDYLPLVLPDWNLWNNLDSEGHDPEGNLDGRYISINEVIDAYNAFTNEYAPAGSIITIDNVIDLYSAFCNVTPM